MRFLLLFLLLTIPSVAQRRVRYFDASRYGDSVPTWSMKDRHVIQRIRLDHGEVIGYAVHLRAFEPASVSIDLLDDAGGSGLPEFIDRQLRDKLSRRFDLSVRRTGVDTVVTHMLAPSERITITQPSQLYVALRSNDSVGVLYDTVDNSDDMCGDGNPNRLSAHELSVMMTWDSAGTRLWRRVKGNGAFFVELIVKPLPASKRASFEDVTASAFDGTLSGDRIAWGDYDNDGDQDLLASGTLWTNDGSGKMTKPPVAPQVSGLAIWADIDNDGWLDIVSATRLWQNRGDGTFMEQFETGLVDAPSNTTLSAADYDGDGFLDLFVGTWEHLFKIKNPNGSDSADVYAVGYKDHLYRNNGNFTFTETTDGALRDYQETPRGYNPFTEKSDILGYPVLYSSNWVDFDLDGDMDLFMGVYRLGANYLWRNDGGGTFTEVATRVGVEGHNEMVPDPEHPGQMIPSDAYGHTIGSDWEDFDNDGDVDVVLGQLAHPRFYTFSDRTALYRNDSGRFVDINNRDTIAATAGITYDETHADAAWGDYDNDGLLDLYVNAVYDCYNSSLYRQRPDHTFEPVTYQTGTHTDGVRGIVWVDIDNDGDLDLHVGGRAGKTRLFRNERSTAENNWTAVSVRLERGSNRFAIGSTIIVHTTGGRTLRRTITAGYGSQSQKPCVAYFGLGKESVKSVEIELPVGVGFSWEAGRYALSGIETNKHNVVKTIEIPASIHPVVKEPIRRGGIRR